MSATVLGQINSDEQTANAVGEAFVSQIRPFLEQYCIRCHNVDNQESGIRIDNVAAEPTDRQLYLLKDIQRQLELGAMPPVDQLQPTSEETERLVSWISDSIRRSRSSAPLRNGSIRRLTVAQYRNALKDLLGLEEDLTDTLPPDAISKDGFTNNTQAMVLSPLQIETYMDIAAAALDCCIVDPKSPPVIQVMRMELGKSLNSAPCPDPLILGANSELLNNLDFLVTEPQLQKPFEFTQFKMRTTYDFIEGYVGNDTVRAWRKFDSIYHSVFACVRGTPGYPKGRAYEVVDAGLLLRPAIPSAEIFEVENTYGPKANFKISLRELPKSGNFRVRVKATKYDDGLLLDEGMQIADSRESAVSISFPRPESESQNFELPGIYQVDVIINAAAAKQPIQLQIDDRHFSGQLFEPSQVSAQGTRSSDSGQQAIAFLLVRLDAGEHKVSAQLGDNSQLRQIRFTRLEESCDIAKQFQIFESRTPTLGVHLGLRRDCGSTLTQVGDCQRVDRAGMHEYVFSGAIRDFPNPEVEDDNVNYLAGIREIGVRSEYTDGRDMPRLLIHSVEFEGPFYSEWPPQSHRNIFIERGEQGSTAEYAKAILESFASRAYRRPIAKDQLERLMQVWLELYSQQSNFERSIRDTLLVVLASPQFLFIVENSSGPEAEDLDEFELASKLSFFLWNSPPDQRLIELAQANQLRQNLISEVNRMVDDNRFSRFVDVFASEWLSLEKFDVVSIDRKQFPRLTRDVRSQLRQEPAQFLKHLFKHNLPAHELIQSKYVLANEVVAQYYGLSNSVESGFNFAPVMHLGRQHGGLISQAAILSGLSNGRQSNPVKRGAWLARKIMAEPPDDPPPNVPQLKEDDGSKRTLRERIEAHRNQKGCVKCHTGIDPWGIPLEAFDAGGLFRRVSEAETESQLPDGTQVKSFEELQSYLANSRIDQVAHSFVKHLATYAVGRDLTYNEVEFLREKGLELRSTNYPSRDILHFIIHSDMFLKK